MLKRRKKTKISPNLTSGPGCVAQSLGIHSKKHHGIDLLGNTIWLMHKTHSLISHNQIVETTRIGVEYAGESAKLNWRFYLKNSEFVSHKMK
jgi:DNA-3-methyladenine glycosylase